MSEYELLSLLREATDSIAGLLQWWASISLAMMVVGHFAGDKLRLPLVVSILILYTSFTILIYLLMDQRGGDILNILVELQSLETLTEVGSGQLNTDGATQVASFVASALSFLGTYIAAVAYLVWRFNSARQQRGSSSPEAA